MMRLSTILSVAALAASSAALAQVASTPAEQKGGNTVVAANITGPNTAAGTADNAAPPADPAAANAAQDHQDSVMGNTASTTPPR